MTTRKRSAFQAGHDDMGSEAWTPAPTPTATARGQRCVPGTARTPPPGTWTRFREQRPDGSRADPPGLMRRGIEPRARQTDATGSGARRVHDGSTAYVARAGARDRAPRVSRHACPARGVDDRGDGHRDERPCVRGRSRLVRGRGGAAGPVAARGDRAADGHGGDGRPGRRVRQAGVLRCDLAHGPDACSRGRRADGDRLQVRGIVPARHRTVRRHRRRRRPGAGGARPRASGYAAVRGDELFSRRYRPPDPGDGDHDRRERP